jgi:hypothetical protein
VGRSYPDNDNDARNYDNGRSYPDNRIQMGHSAEHNHNRTTTFCAGTNQMFEELRNR